MKIFFCFLLLGLIPLQSESGEFKNLKEAVTQSGLTYINAHPPKGAFTIVFCHDYKFENRREVPEDVLNAILDELNEDLKSKYISSEKFPYGQEFPILAETPERKIDFYFMGPFVYLNEEEVRVDVGHSWARMKSFGVAYSVRKLDGDWVCTKTGLNF